MPDAARDKTRTAGDPECGWTDDEMRRREFSEEEEEEEGEEVDLTAEAEAEEKAGSLVLGLPTVCVSREQEQD